MCTHRRSQSQSVLSVVHYKTRSIRTTPTLESTLQCFVRGDSAPRWNPLPFCIPLWKKRNPFRRLFSRKKALFSRTFLRNQKLQGTAYAASVYRMRMFLVSHLCIFGPQVFSDPIRCVFKAWFWPCGWVFKCLGWPFPVTFILLLFKTHQSWHFVSLRPETRDVATRVSGRRWVQSTELDIVNGSFCNLCALAVGLALRIFATKCWRAPRRTKQLSTVAILLYRFLSCWCLETFFTQYQPCSLLFVFLRTLHPFSKPLEWSQWTTLRENIKHCQKRS